MAAAAVDGAMSGFDRLAKPYQWMEYLSFGRALEQCRFCFLSELKDTKHALLLGDGDGRFTAAMLVAADRAHADALDGSAAMLAATRARCDGAGVGARLVTHCADLTQALPDALRAHRYDVVTTNFFLDCLSTEQVNALVVRVLPLLADGACWVVSDFAVPERGLMRWPAWLVVRGLYLSFKLLTGLRVQRLPEHREVLAQRGFMLQREVLWMGGLLRSEMWTLAGKGRIEETL